MNITTQTLQEVVRNAKIRKGPADGCGRNGAFWLTSTRIAGAGGDGIGQSSAHINFHCEVLHYRSGDMRARFCRRGWHQNYTIPTQCVTVPELLEAQHWEDIEQLFARAAEEKDWERDAIADWSVAYREGLWAAFPDAPTSPDD